MNFNCPHCNQLLTDDASKAGRAVACPSCRGTLRVPLGFHCPHCRQLLVDDVSKAGREMVCPVCHGRLRMPMGFPCPHCGQLLVDDVEKADRAVICPACNRSLRVPIHANLMANAPPSASSPKKGDNLTGSRSWWQNVNASLAALFSSPPGRGRHSSIRVNGSLSGDGSFSVDVVGESQYQDALATICGGYTPEGHNLEATAVLVLDDGNPYDNKAVRVEIEGRTVGHLSRANAREYRRELQKQGCPSLTLSCCALIVGGWDRGSGDRGYFGVNLDF